MKNRLSICTVMNDDEGNQEIFPDFDEAGILAVARLAGQDLGATKAVIQRAMGLDPVEARAFVVGCQEYVRNRRVL